MISSYDIFQKRIAYSRNGYSPVAIREGEKFPTQKDWLNDAHNGYWATTYPRAKWLNTGISSRGLRVIDIDLDDPQQVKAVEDWCVANIGSAPTRYRLNAARIALLYRAETGEPRKSYARNRQTKQAVEILGLGQQVFVDGMHPSGYPVEWRQGCPQTVKAEDLHSVSDEQAKALLTFCEALIEADSSSFTEYNFILPDYTGVGEEWFAGDLEKIMDIIPNQGLDWDYWFKIGAAVFAASCGSDRGFRAFLQWSQKCHGHSDANTARLWSGLRHNPTSSISAGTLYHYAREVCPDWEKPSTNGFRLLPIFNRKKT